VVPRPSREERVEPAIWSLTEKKCAIAKAPRKMNGLEGKFWRKIFTEDE
jgi:hypothetical protein